MACRSPSSWPHLALAFAFPLRILWHWAGDQPNCLRCAWCVLYVELIRGVPLIALLFMASVMFPLFMPEGVNVDKLLRAQIAIILFAGAYLAEVVRGGLQALSKGQAEAADALGLTYWQKTVFIILPQALRLVIPPLVNTFIGFFKDTSLVLIVGMFDLLMMGKVALSDPPWQSFSTEIYMMLAVIYIVFCFAMSKYSRGLERELEPCAPPLRRIHDERSCCIRTCHSSCRGHDRAAGHHLGQGEQMVRHAARAARRFHGRGREGTRRGVRAVRLRQVDHDTLHQPSGDASGRQDRSSTASS